MYAMILVFVVHVERPEYKRRVCEKSCAGVVKTLVIKSLVQHVGTPTDVSQIQVQSLLVNVTK